MLAYIVRRLLLMIPTLIGVTFLIFSLVALAPGGLTASALAATGGGAPPGIDPRVAEAEFLDRFGLDRPFLVQYLSWLGRMSPVKFGERAQIDSTGQRLYPPASLPEPASTGWGGAAAPVLPSGAGEIEVGKDAEALQQQYRRARADYDQARRNYILARASFRIAGAELAQRIGLDELVRGDGLLKDGAAERLSESPAMREAPGAEKARVDAAHEAEVKAWLAVAASEARLDTIFRAHPFPQAGVAIVPGVLSIGAPDLGWSRSRSRPVARLIAEALPVTLMLNAIAVPIIYMIAIPSGMLAAARRGSWFDRLSGGFFVMLWSIPVVWAGTLMIGFLANKQYLGWFPPSGLHSRAAVEMTMLPTWGADGFVRGYLLDGLWHVAMPVACLTYAGFAVLSRQTRAAMLDNFNADFVRTAKAKGVPRRDVVFRHVFRNSLLPLITIFATVFPAMLSGSIVVEKIFSIPGMGSLMLDAISLRDAEIMLANSVMVGFVMLLALLMADILYAVADPRVTYG